MKIVAGLIMAIMVLHAQLAQAAPVPASIPVVASMSIVGDLVQQIGGAQVAVETLVGPDGDTHVFQPTPADAKKLAHASIVFENGLGLEGWMDRLITATDYKGKVVVVSDGIGKTLTLTEDEDSKTPKTVTDPHAWQNIANGRLYVKNIAKALSAADPVNAATYTARAEALDMELAGLDAWVKNEIAKVPAPKRKVISSHDAFGYFANAYGVQFMAPVGVSTEAEPSAKAIKQLIQQIKQNGVRAVFFENMASAKLVQQCADEAGVTVGPALYADALSPKDGPAPTYQAMFNYNVSKLVAAMQNNQL